MNMGRIDPSTPAMPYHPSLGWSIAKNATRGLVAALNGYLEAKIMLHQARDAREKRIAEINYRNQQQELQKAQILVEQSKLALERNGSEAVPVGNPDPSIGTNRETKSDQDLEVYKAQLKQESDQEKRDYEQKFIEAQNKQIDEIPDLTADQRQLLKINPSGQRSKLLNDAMRISLIRQYNTPEDAQRLIQQYISPASDADIAEIEGLFNDLSKIDEWEKAGLVDIETAELVRQSVFVGNANLHSLRNPDPSIGDAYETGTANQRALDGLTSSLTPEKQSVMLRKYEPYLTDTEGPESLPEAARMNVAELMATDSKINSDEGESISKPLFAQEMIATSLPDLYQKFKGIDPKKLGKIERISEDAVRFVGSVDEPALRALEGQIAQLMNYVLRIEAGTAIQPFEYDRVAQMLPSIGDEADLDIALFRAMGEAVAQTGENYYRSKLGTKWGETVANLTLKATYDMLEDIRQDSPSEDAQAQHILNDIIQRRDTDAQRK